MYFAMGMEGTGYWLVAMALPSSYCLSSCELPVLDVAEFSATHLQELFALHFRGKRPVLLRGAAAGPKWHRAQRKWARPHLLKKYGHFSVHPHDLHRGCNLVGGLAQLTRAGGISVRSAMQSRRHGCLYLHPHHPLPKAFRGDFEVPAFLRDVHLHGPSISIGGQLSIALLHRHEEAWMAQVHGRKFWLIGLPEIDIPEANFPMPHRCTSLLRLYEDSGGNAPVQLLRCVASPKDIVYIPDHWAHATCGLDAYNIGVGFIGPIDALPPLHRAAVTGDLMGAIDFSHEPLHRAGAGMLNSEGLQPLEWASWNGHVKLVKILSQSTSLTSFASEHDEALHWAAARGHRAVVEHLLHQGFAIVDSNGISAAHWAATAGHVDVLRAVLAHGISANVQDKQGSTLVHWLAGEGHTCVLEFLIRARAEFNASDDEGMLPMHAAAHFGHVALLQALLYHGAETNMEVSHGPAAGARAVHLAGAAGHAAAVSFLLGH